jgi:uncharacterized protein
MLPDAKPSRNQATSADRRPIANGMKLHRDAASGLNAVTAYGAGYVVVNEQRFERGLILLPDRIVEGWAAAGFAGLDQAEMRRLVELAPELVLLGTGARQRFPAPALLGPLLDARIGFEIMDLQAACRTYNILMAEGRRVAAALLFD